MKKKLLFALALVLCVCLLSGCSLMTMASLSNMLPEDDTPRATAAPAAPAASGDTVTISRADYERYRQFDELLDIMDIVEENYYQDVDTEAMLQGAAAGLLDAIDDPYTFYYTPEEYAQMWEDDEGEYAGIGIQISGNYTTQICTIVRVFPGGPAEQAGVQRGDILYMVGEDLYVTADTLDDAVSIMRGTPGTDVDVTFLRDGEPYTVTLTRATIQTTRVESTMLENNVGLIVLYEFAGDCANEFATALRNLRNQGAEGIIIDLRDNGGGWVQDARSIADLFLPSGTLCYLEYKNGERYYYRTTTDGKEVSLPLVILVNEYTASSSEILTGCLRDRTGAKVVGVNSYGKGIVQGVISLESGAGMQVTEAQYFTPDGHAVHKIGIAPDVEIEVPEDAQPTYLLGDLNDVQMNAAYLTMLEMLGK
ncbi:MAG: S41 family peptidase [Clostridia bacterium]|nr:S41 family peptidase [Clostridia bacterium]